MFRNALRPAVLPLLLVLLAAAAQAQTGAASPACATAVARDFNRLMPLLAEVQRDGHDELPGLVGRLNALRARITAAMDEAAPTGEPCETLARDLLAERELLQRLVPAPVVQPPPVAAPVAPAAALPASPLPLRAKAPVRPAERAVERRVAAPPPTPVKRAAYTPPPPASAPRLDPQLESCKTQLRQSHADAQQQLQMAARSGRIAPQKLPDMQRAQSRLAGLQGAVRRDFETLGECQQVGQALVQEVDGVQALAR